MISVNNSKFFFLLQPIQPNDGHSRQKHILWKVLDDFGIYEEKTYGMSLKEIYM